jgi:hypothetical protein
VLFSHPLFGLAAANANNSSGPLVLLLMGTCFGLVNAIVADSKGKNPLLWFFIGFIPILGMIALLRLPPTERPRLAPGSPIPWPRLVMAGVRGFATGVLPVAGLYCLLILVVCFINMKLLDTFALVPFLLDTFVAASFLSKLTAVAGAVGLVIGVWFMRRASKGLDPELTDFGPPKETRLAIQVDKKTPLPPSQRDYREAFKPLVEQYHRERGLCGMVVFGACGYFLIVSVLFSWWPWIQEHVAPWLNFVVLLVPIMVFLMWLRPQMPTLPNCPACRKSLGPPFGRYCPECACPLKDEKIDWGLSQGWYCWTSEKVLRAGRKIRNFKYHYCSHCGVMLHDEGL